MMFEKKKLMLPIVILFTIVVNSLGQNPSLTEYEWKQTATNFSVYGYNYKGIQGAAYFEGKYYQFHDKTGGIRIYDVNTMSQVGQKSLNCDVNLHYGSVAFSKEFSYTKNGVETHTQLPLIYATGHYAKGAEQIIDVIDVENDVLVRQYKFPKGYDDGIAAWDFDNNRCWLIHYGEGYAITPYYINEYSYDEQGYYPVTENDAAVVIPNDGTLQDCQYVDGKIFILVGWGDYPSHFTEYSNRGLSVPEHIYGKIHCYDVNTKKIETTLQSNSCHEFEGFAYVPQTDSFIATSWNPQVKPYTAYYWHVAKPQTEPYYVTLAADQDCDRYNVDAEKNYELYSLRLDDMADAMKVPADAKSIKAVNVEYSRERMAGFNSFCLPFALDRTMLPEGARIYVVESVNAATGELRLQECESVEAGVACFVRAEGTLNVKLNSIKDNAGELYIVVKTPADAQNGWTGSFESKKIGEGYYKINDEGTALVRTNAFSDTYPFRAYLQMPETASQAKFTIICDDTEAITNVAERIRDSRIYTLDGRLVESDQKTGGVYVTKGKKIVKK